MKTITTQILFLSFIISFLLFSFSLFAHSGRTNSAGCHKVTKTGGYHCHNSGTTSSNNNNNNDNDNDNDNNEDIKTENIIPTKEIEGTFAFSTFPTQYSDLVIKNFRCTTNWKVDIINRSTKPYVVYITFYTVDKDGDPLLSVLFRSKIYTNVGRKINGLSRQTFDLKSFDCSLKFDEINFSVQK